MNTLEERLKKSEYYERLRENERDKELIASMKRELELSGQEMPPELRKFEESVRNVDAALAAEYEATVAVVDARNDLEFTLLDIFQRLEDAAEECEETDPEKAEQIRSIMRGEQSSK